MTIPSQRRKLAVTFALTTLLAACSPPARPQHDPGISARATSNPRPPPPPVASAPTPAPSFAPPAPAPESPPFPRGVRKAPASPRPSSGEPSGHAPEAWLTLHGVTASAASGTDPLQEIYGCDPVRVGVPLRDGVWCLNTSGPMKGSLGSGESVFPLEVKIVEGHVLRTVLRVPIAAGALDRMEAPRPDDPNQGNYIQLDAQLARDGSSITIREKAQPETKCAAALARTPQPDLAPVLANARRMVELACRSRGRYVWRGDRFVRDEIPSAAGAPVRSTGVTEP